MLVLSRKVGDKIVISNNIVLQVIEIKDGRVRLGFAAPKEVPIYRKELLTRENNAPTKYSTNRKDGAPGRGSS